MRKLKIVAVLNFIFDLVTSNPIQGLQSCPLTQHQNYVDINPSSVPKYFDAYTNSAPQIQNQQYQLPNTYEEQIKRLYLENILSNAISNSYAEPNLMFNQNQIDLSRYVANPSRNLPNAFNNGFEPQDPLNNQSVGNGINKYLPQTKNKYGNHLWVPNYSNTYNDDTYSIIANILSNNKVTRNRSSNKQKIKNQEQGNKRPKNMGYSKRKKSGKSKKPKSHNSNKDDKTVLKENNEKYNERPKFTVSHLSNTDNSEKFPNNNNNRMKGVIKNSGQKVKNRRTLKSNSNLMENEVISETEMINSKRKDISLPQIKTTECLDINEDCTDLESRRTRNNYNSDVIQHQFSGIPKEFTESVGYINNFMANQNFNTDLFGGQGNFPYNFDYLYQITQNTNSQLNGSDNRRRRRRKKKKQKTNSETSTEPPSNNQTKEKPPYDLILELLPKVSDVDAITESIPTEIATVKEIDTEQITIEKKTIDATTISNYPAVKVTLYPDNTEEHPSNYLNEEYKDPFVYDNRIDDYYPDFKLDNIYLSKEDNDLTFHGRHFYSSDDNPEFRRERRKYDSSYKRQVLENDKQDSFRLNERKNTHIDIPKEFKTSQEEIEFRTPPELEFPDFKTQMVNKDSYKAGDKTSAYSSSNLTSKLHKNSSNNTVETVYGNSKVVKYGAMETADKEKSFDHIKNNIYTSDEDTTVVIAKSLS